MKMPEIDALIEWRLLVVPATAWTEWSFAPTPGKSSPCGCWPHDRATSRIRPLSRRAQRHWTGSALLMRDVPVTCHALNPMRSVQPAAVTAP